MSPLCAPTLPNNGVVHLLQQLAKHWNNMLDQKFGNFAHQRMEQLDPFGTLRGRNRWGAHVLGPFIQKLLKRYVQAGTLVMPESLFGNKHRWWQSSMTSGSKAMENDLQREPHIDTFHSVVKMWVYERGVVTNHTGLLCGVLIATPKKSCSGCTKCSCHQRQKPSRSIPCGFVGLLPTTAAT